MPGIMVMSIGGAGKNVINRLMDSGASGVEFISTDFWDLHQSKAPIKLELKSLYPGLTFPESGNPARLRRQESARAESNKIRQAITGARALIVVAGTGGHTGAGVSPVVAQIARQCGIFTVTVFMLPFGFEGESARRMAAEAVKETSDNVDVLMTVAPWEFMHTNDNPNLGLEGAFKLADDVMAKAVQNVLSFVTVAFIDSGRQ